MFKDVLKCLFPALLAVISFSANAQTGTIRGSVFDGATGEPVIGASVQIVGTSVGSATDLDGKFSITTAPGTYSLQISMITYQTVVLEGLVVSEGKVTLADNVRLQENVETLQEVVISATALKSSESAMLTVKRKSGILMDGISSDKFRQIGDSDASEAVKRVTGVNVEGGKYVFIRGLGDRYSKTTLNSVDVPGLDPDRNSIQIDIFPTNLIDNMTVLKSASAEMPADFTGGVVNIETKDFPEEKLLNVSFGLSYNPTMHFNKSYFTYKGGSTDWLGIDDGTRELPAQARDIPFPTPGASGVSPAQVNSFVNSFNKTLAPTTQTSFMDFNFGLSAGDQKNFRNGHSLGYIFSLTYKSSTFLYDDVIYGEYQRPAFPDEYELVYATVQTGQVAERNILLGGLAGIAYKTQYSKYKLSLLHLQNGESRAAQFFIDDNGSAVGKSGFTGLSDNLEYSQRGVTNLMLSGEHRSQKSLSIDWRLSGTSSKITEPDIRKTAFTITSSDTVFSPGAAGQPSRIWRYLDEVNLVGKVDVKKQHFVGARSATLRFGASQMFKERDYEILSFDLQFFGSQPDYDGDPTVVLNEEYIYPNGTVYFSSGNPTPNSNAYNSTIYNTAFYLSEEFELVNHLKAILGIRAENYVQRHTGRDAIYAGGDVINGNNLSNAVVLDNLHFFPSANFIYALSDIENLRLSYSRTIARPSFKDMSYAQILDPVSNRIFNGGLFKYSDWDGNLRETLIDNFDLRWEKFMAKNQLFSVSAFYKRFQDPIELVRIPEAQTTNEFQPRNVGNGAVLGAEIEFRKSLEFISPRISNFSLSGNFTLVKSTIEMTAREFNARKGYEKEGQTVEDTREMAGQAPYLINFGFAYENSDHGIDGGFFYNVSGPTLTVVGGGLFPDVYSEPFHSLNFNLNKSFGKEKRTMLTLSATNLLNDAKENFFRGFNAQDQYYSKLNPGRSIGFGFRYKI